MHDLYTRLTDLLGKPQEVPSFCEFVSELGAPATVYDAQHVCFYNFPKSGVQILAQVEGLNPRKFFHSVIFFLDVPDVRHGLITPYCKQFLTGVMPDDSMKDVEHKIGIAPMRWRTSVNYWEQYDFQDHRVQFIFDGESEHMS